VSLFAQNSMCARISFKNPIQCRCTYRSSVILVSAVFEGTIITSTNSLHKKSQVGQDWAHLLYLVARSTYWQSLWLYLELLLNFEYIEKTHTRNYFRIYLAWGDIQSQFALSNLENTLSNKKSCRLICVSIIIWYLK